MAPVVIYALKDRSPIYRLHCPLLTYQLQKVLHSVLQSLKSSVFGDKILQLGSVAVLRSLIRILRASLAQIDTEMAEKYAKLAEI